MGHWPRPNSRTRTFHRASLTRWGSESGDGMKRRELITLLGGAAMVWPLAARAQRKLPLIGFLEGGSVSSPEVRRGLAEHGYILGIDYDLATTWSESQQDRLVANSTDLVRRGAAVILAVGNEAALAAKAATNSIPIIFLAAYDPIATGLVNSLNRPGGNLTGAASLATDLMGKKFEILHELAPTASSAVVLVNSTNKLLADTEIREAQIAAQALGLHLSIAKVATIADVGAALEAVPGDGAAILVIGAGPQLFAAGNHLAYLATRNKVPTIYGARQFAESGGLVSFGTRVADGWYLMGVYAARVLKGEKPADLPVQQITKTELVINLHAAKAIGLVVPPTLLGRADEVIE